MYAEAAPPPAIRSLIYDGVKHKIKLTEMSKDGGKTLYLPWLRMLAAPYAWDQEHYAVNFMTPDGFLVPAIIKEIEEVAIVGNGIRLRMKNGVERMLAPHISGGYSISLVSGF
jgi:hypothetical protein